MTDLTTEFNECSSGKARSDAWWNVFCAFLIFFAVLGVPAMVIPVLYGSIMDDTGWSRGDVALLSSIKFGVGAIAAYMTGPLVERFGVKIVTIYCSLISGAGLLLMLFVHNLAILYLVGAFLGVGALGVTTAMKIFISQWFSKRQGVALGVALMGTSTAGIVIPYLATIMAQSYGWRETCAVMSLTIWLVALPVFIWRAKEKPRSETTQLNTTKEILPEHLPAFKDIRFKRMFLTSVVIVFLIGMIDHGISAHLVLFFDRDVNFGAEMAAIAFSITMVMSNVGKLGYGWVFDRFSTRGVAICWIIVACGISILFSLSGIVTLVIFALIYGSTQGGMLLHVPILAKHCFGKKAMVRSIAVLTTCFMMGSAFGPAFAGYLRDMTGSYTLPFCIFIGAALVASALTWTLKAPYRTLREAVDLSE